MILEEKMKIGSSSIHYLFNAYHSSRLEGNHCLQQMSSLEGIQAGELPILCAFLRQLDFSGKISLYLPENSQQEYTHILFHHGKIELVHHSDSSKKDLLLGQMFIAHGYLHGDDLREFLEEEKFRNKNGGRIGDRLISKNLLSPHALENILMEQIHVRLLSLSQRDFFHFSITTAPGSTNANANVNASVNASVNANANANANTNSPKEKSLFLSDARLDICLHNWIMSKIRVGWLKSLYTSYQNKQVFFHLDSYLDRKNSHSLIPSDQLYLIRFFMESALPVISATDAFHSSNNISSESEKALSVKSLFDGIKNKNIDENLFSQSLYFATLKGFIRFSSQEESAEATETISLKEKERGGKKQENREETNQYLTFLQALHQSMKGQGPMELFYIMGGKGTTKLNKEEINQIYTDFLKKINPGNKNLSLEYKQAYEQILSWALQGREAAIECVKGSGKNSEEMANSILSFETTRQLKAKQKIQEAQNLLADFRTEEAFDLLDPLRGRAEKYKNFSVCMLWIHLQRFIKNEKQMSESQRAEAIQNLDKSFHSTPLEEESMELPVYVKGLYHKVTGNLSEALRCFEISLQLCPSFVPARRDMNLCFLEQKDQGEDSHSHIKRVFPSVFNKSS